MRFFFAPGSGRVTAAVGLIVALGAINCGGRSHRSSAAAGASGSEDASGGLEGSGGASAHGGQLSAGGTSGGSGAAGSAGQSGAAGAGGHAGTTPGWTLPHTSDQPWRRSVEPLCAPEGTGLPWDLWSDERGIYVLADAGRSTSSLHFNDGTGWSTLPTSQPDFFGLTGFSNGPLVLYSGRPCGVVFQDGDEGVCASTLPGISRVFAVDPSRTFAIAGNRVLRYNGEYFTQYGKPLPQDYPTRPYGFWADAEVVIASNDQGHVYILPDADSEAEALTLPAAAPAHSLWAFGRDDIWVGLEENRIAHYDGANWTVQSVGELTCGAVTDMWGSDHVLFFASSTFVGKVQDGVLYTLAAASECGPDNWTPGVSEELVFRKIWGNSPTEVFFAVTERRFEVKLGEQNLETTITDPDACGMQRLYWYDGTRIRPL